MRSARIFSSCAVVALAAALTCALSLTAFAEEPVKDATDDAGLYIAAEIDDSDVEPADPPAPVSAQLQSMYRLYNIQTWEHFYTASADERENLIDAGWFDEGFGWFAPSVSNTPVYRLYNPNVGDHHYTISNEERSELVAAGWTDEGIGWYSDDAQTVPVYRQYNPNAYTGSHNFTTNKSENDSLVGSGWSDEGTAWYAVVSGLNLGPSRFSRNNLQTIVDLTPGENWITLGYNTVLTEDEINTLYGFIDAEPSVAFMAINANTGKCIAYLPDRKLFSASSAKAPYIASLCKYEAPGIAGYEDVLYDTITNSSNESFAYLNSIYGKDYIYAFAREAGFEPDIPFDPAYAYFTPREIVKLWIDIHEFLESDATYSNMYRSLFGRGSIYKEGWMFPIAWCGQIYNLTGDSNGTVYGIMSRAENQDPMIFALRDTLVSLTS